MTLQEYLWFIMALFACAIFSAYASHKVTTTFRAFNARACRSNMTGYDTAIRLLRANGVYDISVGRVRGTLSDHYHPTKKVVNLSDSTYGSPSVGAVAVAAHEIGHVMQKKKGYLPYKIRTALVPVVNIGSRLALPLVIIGMLLDLFVYMEGESSLGFTLAMVGVVLYGSAFLFQLVTLPVEFNASKRAKKMLLRRRRSPSITLSSANNAAPSPNIASRKRSVSNKRNAAHA